MAYLRYWPRGRSTYKGKLCQVSIVVGYQSSKGEFCRPDKIKNHTLLLMKIHTNI